MAHGDKRWIVDWKGRRKRSSNRTYDDWKGSLHTWDHYGFCPQCKGLRNAYGTANDVTHYEWRRWENVVEIRSFPVTRWVNGEARHSWRKVKFVVRTFLRDRVELDDAHKYPRAELWPCRRYVWMHRIECRRCREKSDLQWKMDQRGEPRHYYKPTKDDRQHCNGMARARARAALQRAKLALDFDDVDVLTNDRRTFDEYW